MSVEFTSELIFSEDSETNVVLQRSERSWLGTEGGLKKKEVKEEMEGGGRGRGWA